MDNHWTFAGQIGKIWPTAPVCPGAALLFIFEDHY